MADVFISYRRKESSQLADNLVTKLKQRRISVFLDTRNTDGGGPFPPRLLAAIERSRVFVCLLGATTLESDWVQKEIEHAHKHKKVLIPVFQESYQRPAEALPAVAALLQNDGVHFMDVKNIYIDDAIDALVKLIRPYQRPLRLYAGLLTLALLAAVVIGFFVLRPLFGGTDAAVTPTVSPTPTSSPSATASPTPEVSPTATVAPCALWENGAQGYVIGDEATLRPQPSSESTYMGLDANLPYGARVEIIGAVFFDGQQCWWYVVPIGTELSVAIGWIEEELLSDTLPATPTPVRSPGFTADPGQGGPDAPTDLCGDLNCDPGEEQTCPRDCPLPPTAYVPPAPVCGNLICEAGEPNSCPRDCRIVPTQEGAPSAAVCGNLNCEAGETTSCPRDCPIAPTGSP
ncbi:MAG: TIR domain-containing protein [Chloroflexi bacterium]|nr:TIR domain-containing protein [Chloroflexota bacterium]